MPGGRGRRCQGGTVARWHGVREMGRMVDSARCTVHSEPGTRHQELASNNQAPGLQQPGTRHQEPSRAARPLTSPTPTIHYGNYSWIGGFLVPQRVSKSGPASARHSGLRAGGSAGVLRRLSNDLKNELPEIKGFSERNLKLMTQFFREYPGLFPIGQPVVAQLPFGTQRAFGWSGRTGRAKSATTCG